MAITYITRDTARAADAYVYVQELALELATATVGTVTVTCAKGGQTNAYAWATPSNEPNNADWPNGAYHLQVDVNAIGADLALDTTTRFRRLNAGLTSILNSSGLGFWDTTTGTGLHLYTVSSWDSTPGSASDRFQTYLDVFNGNLHKNQDITLNLNTSSTYADGPWTAATIVELAAAIAGLGVVAADFVRTRDVGVVIAGLGVVAADAAVAVTYETAIAGLGTVSPAISRTRPFEVSIAGTGDVVADFVRIKNLEAAISGLGTVSADISLTKSLAAQISGLGAISPDLRVTVTYATAIAGTGALAVDFVRTVGLEAAIASIGTVSADLTVTPAAPVTGNFDWRRRGYGQ